MRLHYSNVQRNILDVKPDKRTEVFNWGVDNAFPSLVETLISGSVTAKSCTDKVAKAIYGKSFGEDGNVKVNSKGQSLNEALRIASRQYAGHNDTFIHVSYDGNYDMKGINILPCTDVRQGKADDRGYSGKYVVYDNWDKKKASRVSPSQFKKIDRYNPDKNVIAEQVEKAGGIEVYQGQILHIRKDESYIYSLTDLEPVLHDCLTELNSQIFRRRGATKGFLNTKLLTVQPFADDDMRKDFKKDLNALRGAENSSDVLLLETSQMSDDIAKQLKLDDLSGEYNDKLFEYSDKQSERNICKACGVPLILVGQSDSSMFGNSGELIVQAKLQLWEEREEDRDQLEEAFSNLMQLFSPEYTGNLKIISPYQIPESVQN